MSKKEVFGDFMYKCNNKLVFAYINGENIDNVEELENDYKFMIDVMKMSRDKKIYNLCSHEVKNNYEFVRTIIDMFRYDRNFIDDVATYYFDNVSSNEFSVIELYFVMNEIFANDKNDRSVHYKNICDKLYISIKIFIDELVRCEKEFEADSDIGLGFEYVLNYIVNDSDIITRYYAKRFLEEIFYNDNKMKLLEIVHCRLNNVNTIKNIGTRNFILNYIRECDSSLYEYVFGHLGLIKEIEKDVMSVVSNWDSFDNYMLERKHNIFEQEVNNLLMKCNTSFDYIDVCYYLDSLHLDIPVKFNELDYCMISLIDINRINLMEYECLRKITQLAKDLYKNPIIDTEYEYRDEDKKSSSVKPRILKFNPNKKDDV